MNFKTLLPLFLLSFHWSLTNKEANFLSHFYRKNIFIQTRRLWRVRKQPIEPFVIVSRVTRILQLIKKTIIFVSYVIKEFAHAFSCAYIELWMHLGSLESIQEARVALGYRLVPTSSPGRFSLALGAGRPAPKAREA